MATLVATQPPPPASLPPCVASPSIATGSACLSFLSQSRVVHSPAHTVPRMRQHPLAVPLLVLPSIHLISSQADLRLAGCKGDVWAGGHGKSQLQQRQQQQQCSVACMQRLHGGSRPAARQPPPRLPLQTCGRAMGRGCHCPTPSVSTTHCERAQSMCRGVSNPARHRSLAALASSPHAYLTHQPPSAGRATLTCAAVSRTCGCTREAPQNCWYICCLSLNLSCAIQGYRFFGAAWPPMMAGCGRLLAAAAAAAADVAAEPMVGADVLRASPPFRRLQGRWVDRRVNRRAHSAQRDCD